MSGNNTSTELGFLTPTSGPIEDPALTNALQATVVAITGLPATLVRPRWQAVPPNQPPANTNWCAIGVTEHTPDDFPYIEHDPTGNSGNGQDIIHDWETLTVVTSFYGPNSSANAGILRRGLNIGQNRDTLANISVKVTSIGGQTVVPDLINMQYIDHIDVTIMMTRENIARFNVYSLLSADTSNVIADPSIIESVGFILLESGAGYLELESGVPFLLEADSTRTNV
jgi:hypothetical protein